MFVFFHRSVAGSFGNLERNRSIYLMDLQEMVYQKYYLIFWEGSSYLPFFVSIFTKVCSLCWEFFGFIMFLTNMKLDESHVWNISGSKASFLRFSYQECLHQVRSTAVDDYTVSKLEGISHPPLFVSWFLCIRPQIWSEEISWSQICNLHLTPAYQLPNALDCVASYQKSWLSNKLSG